MHVNAALLGKVCNPGNLLRMNCVLGGCRSRYEILVGMVRHIVSNVKQQGTDQSSTTYSNYSGFGAPSEEFSYGENVFRYQDAVAMHLYIPSQEDHQQQLTHIWNIHPDRFWPTPRECQLYSQPILIWFGMFPYLSCQYIHHCSQLQL